MKNTIVVSIAVAGVAFATLPAAAQSKRPMAVEDLLSAIRVGDPQVSPDRQRVLFTRTTTDLSAGKRNADIWTVPADGSAEPRPFIESPKSDDTPRFLPDGRVAFMSARNGAPQVYVADASGGGARAVTHLPAGAQGPLVVSPDGRLVAYVSDVFPSCTDAACNARMSDSAEKDPVKVHKLTRLPFRHWSEWWEGVRHHVFVTEIETGVTRDLTPGDFDASTGFGQKVVDEISQDWCGKVMTDFHAVFDVVARSPNADANRMGIAGASYGGYAVNWLIGHTNRFKAAVSHDGVFNLESMSLATEELWCTDWEFGGAPWSKKARANFAKCSPHLSADRIRTPTLVITNEQDFRVPVDQGLQLFTALRRNGGAVRRAGLRERGTLGPQRARQQTVARDRIRVDAQVSRADHTMTA